MVNYLQIIKSQFPIQNKDTYTLMFGYLYEIK